MLNYILMKNLLKKEEARKFLEEIAQNYTTFSRFEEFVKNYKGENKVYLQRVIRYLRKTNQGANRIYGLGNSEIERILDATLSRETKYLKAS